MTDLAAVLDAIEDMNHRMHDMVKRAADTAGFADLTATQALILHRIAGARQRVTDIITAGYYGTNTSYNLAKLRRNGYLTSAISTADKRVVFYEPTRRGNEVYIAVDDAFRIYAAALGRTGIVRLNETLSVLRGMRRTADSARLDIAS